MKTNFLPTNKVGILLLFILGLTCNAQGQDFGLSFSYFLPRHGDFSTPISPFSFRGLGVNLNKFIALETGVSLYRMSGLGMKDLPFESKKSLVGPNFTIFIPGEFVIQLVGRQAQFDIKAGGFFFHGFFQQLNYGNLDRAIREHEGWDVANSQFTFKNNPGFGFHFGAELLVYINRQFGVSLETNYLAGQSKFAMTGTYTGGLATGPLQTNTADYADAKIDFTGLEFSIGVIMRGGR